MGEGQGCKWLTRGQLLAGKIGVVGLFGLAGPVGSSRAGRRGPWWAGRNGTVWGKKMVNGERARQAYVREAAMVIRVPPFPNKTGLLSRGDGPGAAGTGYYVFGGKRFGENRPGGRPASPPQRHNPGRKRERPGRLRDGGDLQADSSGRRGVNDIGEVHAESDQASVSQVAAVLEQRVLARGKAPARPYEQYAVKYEVAVHHKPVVRAAGDTRCVQVEEQAAGVRKRERAGS